MKYYLQKTESVLNKLSTTTQGLNSQEAEKRLKLNGLNQLINTNKTSIITRILKQILDPMIIVLIIAAFISGLISFFTHESFADVIIIVFVVFINALLGMIQESKAEHAIEALQKITPFYAKTIRDNIITQVKCSDLVVGDIIILETGDNVPADCRIIESNNLEIEESALTGESIPASKISDTLHDNNAHDISLGDRKNMAYMGCSVVYGHGQAVVVNTGMNTEMGKIAHMLNQTKKEQTPLQKKLNKFSKNLSLMIVGICAFIFLFKIMNDCVFQGKVFTDIVMPSFMIAISLAVAAIPEGLATVVTIVLSIGVSNMAKKNVVIRRLTAVETLGCTQIICTDKTGTLTQNKMTVVETYTKDEVLTAKIMSLCNDAALNKNKAIGEPTEAALVNWAYSIGINKNQLKKTNKRIKELPFDSSRKMMSIAIENERGLFQYTKGASDEIIKKCSHILINGQAKIITHEDILAITNKTKEMANKALRVLACAYKKLDKKQLNAQNKLFEYNLTFVGLVGMIDPVRIEVKDAIEICKKAGITPIMITGDHIDTAVAIGKELGIIKDNSQAITGIELNQLSDEQLEKDLENIKIYARVQPEHKSRIVNAWKKKKKITAMTGDGINDAPSIKSADIGIGMGITGTDVTKKTADMVLSDDNFATIVTAVNEGRRIYDNIRKSIQFLLASNLSEVVTIFFATIIGFTLLKPAHLLWINLITDTAPALALGLEKAEKDIMLKKPREKNEGIFSDKLAFDIILHGFFISVITLIAFLLGSYSETGSWKFQNSNTGMTMAFLAMSMSEIFHTFNVRSRYKSILSLKTRNYWIIASTILSLVLSTLVIYVPYLNTAFEFTPIKLSQYILTLELAVSIIPIVEIQKLIFSFK